MLCTVYFRCAPALLLSPSPPCLPASLPAPLPCLPCLPCLPLLPASLPGAREAIGSLLSRLLFAVHLPSPASQAPPLPADMLSPFPPRPPCASNPWAAGASATTSTAAATPCSCRASRSRPGSWTPRCRWVGEWVGGRVQGEGRAGVGRVMGVWGGRWSERRGEGTRGVSRAPNQASKRTHMRPPPPPPPPPLVCHSSSFQCTLLPSPHKPPNVCRCCTTAPSRSWG